MSTRSWVVELEFATAEPIPVDALVELDKDGDPDGRYVNRRQDGPGVVVSAYVEAVDPLDAAHDAVIEVAAWLAEHGLHSSLVGLRVLTGDALESDADTPNYPDIVSAVEAADLLGVSRQRVHQLWRQHPDFPAPLYELRTGPLWVRAGIEKFADGWERRSGRPRASA